MGNKSEIELASEGNSDRKITIDRLEHQGR